MFLEQHELLFQVELWACSIFFGRNRRVIKDRWGRADWQGLIEKGV